MTYHEPRRGEWSAFVVPVCSRVSAASLAHISPRLRGRSGFEKLSTPPSAEEGKTFEHLPRLAYGVYYRFDGATENLYTLRPRGRELAFVAGVLKLPNNLMAEADGTLCKLRVSIFEAHFRVHSANLFLTEFSHGTRFVPAARSYTRHISYTYTSRDATSRRHTYFA